MSLGKSTVGLMRGGRAFAWLGLALALSPFPAGAAERSSENWPTAVQARYSLRYNGITVGSLVFNSSANGKTYTLSGSSKVSVLFGAFSWTASSNVSGTVEGGNPAPSSFAFDWRMNKKSGSTQIGFRDHVAADIAIQPPPRPKPDIVPLKPAHKAWALDPMSAVMMLTKPDNRPPCDRRVGVFDGKHRYDIVLTPKKTTRLPAASGNGPAETAYVCRIMYEPVAGHRDNEDTKAYAANRDAEIVMRRIPGSEMLIPHSATIPTSWGTGSMVTERIDIVTPNAGRIALTN